MYLSSLTKLGARALKRIKADLVDLEVDRDELRKLIDDPHTTTTTRLEARRLLHFINEQRISHNRLMHEILTTNVEDEVPSGASVH